ncbi:lectin-like [Vitis vinifera]|uniref:Protein phloem 2-like A1 n=1 Tax=Vitis vinifera TaxID=29760 RepID=D7T9J9_VITVI|eukprot:XP_010648750.1 PREDICTED: lectin [Vitis vinifera]
MGSSWSQDESSQLSEKPGETLSQTLDINTKAKETIQAKQLPYNYAAIMKDADSPINESSIEKLNDQLYAGVLLNGNRKKFWMEKKFNNCFMIFARNLSITWAEDSRYWHWLKIKETSDVFVDVAELINVCWLEVHGKFETAKLSPGIMYKVAFVVMMKDPAYGWGVPVNLKLALPDGNTQEHKENLREKPKGQWIEIPVGQFQTSAENIGEIEFSLFEYEGGDWKSGLVVKGVIIQPKN